MSSNRRGRKACPGSETHDTKLSKGLSYILRHGALKEGIPISADGYVKVADLLGHVRFNGYSEDDVRKVVEQNDKQRFALKEDTDTQTLLIKANQGHTIEVDLELSEIDPSVVPVAIHGTYEKCIEAIKSKGLSRMSRQHVHMAVDLPGESGVISGMRSSCNYLVYVNVRKAAEDGLKFYKSPNNVILCSGNDEGLIPPKYFIKVVKR